MIDNQLEKYDKSEEINVGDLLTYAPHTNKVTRAVCRKWKEVDTVDVIGVCTNINDNKISFSNNGIVDVNVKGLICLGDELMVSDSFGIAKAIKYEQDETKFKFRHIGKVVGLYNDYKKVKVLLDIE